MVPLGAVVPEPPKPVEVGMVKPKDRVGGRNRSIGHRASHPDVVAAAGGAERVVGADVEKDRAIGLEGHVAAQQERARGQQRAGSGCLSSFAAAKTLQPGGSNE